MKKAKVLHNPGAGEGDTSEEALIAQIESAGFKCSYSSTKQFHWENIETEDIDFLVLAGGDGTVRRIAQELLKRKVIEKKLPIALLPFGTANNIANTLGLFTDTKKLIEGWRLDVVKNFDVGIIGGLKSPAFFLESFGCGVFPKLMQEMKRQKKNNIEDPKRKLQAALEILCNLIADTPAKRCDLEINGKDYSGAFLLIEVMNIRSMGPNLNLAPNADPGDGAFDIVLITEEQREPLAQYVQGKLEGREVPFDFPVLKASALNLTWGGKHLHVDDQYCKVKQHEKVSIELRQGLLQFLLPEEHVQKIQRPG